MKKAVCCLICFVIIFSHIQAYADFFDNYTVSEPDNEYVTSCSKPIQVKSNINSVEKELFPTSFYSDSQPTFNDLLEWVLAVMYDCTEEFYTNVQFNDGTIDEYMLFDVTSFNVPLNYAKKIIMLLNYEYGDILASNYYLYDTIEVDGYYYDIMGFKYIYDDLSVVKEKRAQIKDKADIIINKINSDNGLTDLEKVLLVHDYIGKNAYYQPDKKLIEDFYYHTLDSALLEGVTVCQGYTLAMTYILNRLGIECISCRCDEVNHVWNCVKIDGKWYHIDLTWNDGRYVVGADSYDFIEYDNFVTSSFKQLVLKFYQYYLTVCENEGSNEISEEEQNYIDKIKNIYTNIINGSYSDKQLTQELEGILKFEYITLLTDNNTSNNKEFEEGFVFNEIAPVKFKTSENSPYYYLRPNGFEYDDDKFKMIINTSTGSPIPPIAEFEFQELKADYISFAIPIAFAEGFYLFGIGHTDKVSDFMAKSHFMSNKTSDDFVINNVTFSKCSRLATYLLAQITDPIQVNAINNFEETQFFFWNSNMCPFSKKIIYKNQ